MPIHSMSATCPPRRCAKATALLLALAGLSSPAAAQTAPVADTVLPTPLADAPKAPDVPDAAELAALGQMLNTQGQFDLAAEHLERALMLDPGRKDAQLSYAIALTGMGDLASAQALLQDLLADPALPGALRQHIDKQLAAVQALLAPALAGSPWQRRMALSARVGYDSNLLGSPGLGSLALTLGGQTVLLPLDDSYLAQGGAYLRTDAQLSLQHRQPNATQWDIIASLRRRQSPGTKAAGATQLDLLAEHSATAPQGHYLSLSASRLQAELGIRYQTLGLAGGWAIAWPTTLAQATCQTRLGGQWQARRYLDNPLLSGNYTGLAAFVACAQYSGLQWLWALKAGHDAAQSPQRPGGNQTSASLQFAAQQPLAAWSAQPWLQRSKLLLELERSQQHDATRYSAIIANGATRSVARWSARLEWQYQPGTTTQWVLGAEQTHQRSNLPLFGMRNWGAYSAVRVQW